MLCVLYHCFYYASLRGDVYGLKSFLKTFQNLLTIFQMAQYVSCKGHKPSCQGYRLAENPFEKCLRSGKSPERIVGTQRKLFRVRLPDILFQNCRKNVEEKRMDELIKKLRMYADTYKKRTSRTGS